MRDLRPLRRSGAGGALRELLPLAGIRRLKLAALAVAAIAAACSVEAAIAAHATTQPVLAYKVHVVITDAGARIDGKRLVTWPRGAVIQFYVKNRGTRPYRALVKLVSNYHFTKFEAKIRQLQTPVIAPGKTGTVRVFFYYRSTFKLAAGARSGEHGSPATIRIV